MTKQVRIENADTADYKVQIEVWDKGINGELDKMVEVLPLDYPTAMAMTYITSTRYLVVKEAPAA